MIMEREREDKKRTWDSVYANMAIALEQHGNELPETERQKLQIAKSFLGSWLDKEFPIMERALLFRMAQGR